MSEEGIRSFFPILTRRPTYPRKPDGTHYDYTFYRQHIAEDCQRRCVYCDATEDDVGGPEAMQVDHFRPGSFNEFSHLFNDPLNLHYGCGRCNLWKSNKWPARGTPHTHDGTDGFLDPFVDDRLAYFSVDATGRIYPLQPPAHYIVRLLHLEREFLRRLREKRLLLAEAKRRWTTLKSELQADIDAGRQTDPTKVLELLADIEHRLLT